jgi:hypothetical protein
VNPTPLKVNELLIVRAAENGDLEELGRFVEALAEAVGVPVVVLPKGASLSSPSEEKMREAGWVRADPR